ncbi:uncharacterized protein HD556DRAFT_1306035 [Suillus plorans]|uniref:Uncharacterized protein n=1 Tax=Suillus plorans TaxID=116603 RepID=A0A9P7DMP5_9AGAM|nr:uncharacterized protein HD556DRAFT_1306035 [Suillus plorans]KAG1798586.1 hypothetical protein HD556DRAFT_1306035 [Suillus plorans]
MDGKLNTDLSFVGLHRTVRFTWRSPNFGHNVGPQPLPAAHASQIEGKSGVEEFFERDERRRKLQEEASKPVILPGALLCRSRQFLCPSTASPSLSRGQMIRQACSHCCELFKVKKGLLDLKVHDFTQVTHQRISTDANVRDPEISVEINKAVETAYEGTRKANIILDSSVELALELIAEANKKNWGYYFVDHDRRVIFWFEDYESPDLVNNVRGVERKSTSVCSITQPKRYIELFPNKRVLPEDIVVTLKEIVMHAHAENITSETCLAPFALSEVASMLGLVDHLKGELFPDAGKLLLIIFSDSTNEEREHSGWIAGNAKFVNFCGQPGARLDIDQSLYGEHDTRSNKIILRIMDVILFGSPAGKFT